ncbi:hypothetical protein ACLI4Q_06010 [Natrialbaceae archaeon A-CW1-1]
MALTEHNRGTISSFVHEQLTGLRDAHLVVHPPKQFAYTEQLELIATLLELTDRELAIENTSVPSDWYTPETIAFFGYVGSHYERLDGLYLTIDTAHLPSEIEKSGPLAIDQSAVSHLDNRLTVDGVNIPPEFIGEMNTRLRRLESYIPDHYDLEEISSLPYASVLRALCLAGNWTKEIHFNDPQTDLVPDPLSYENRPLFEAVLECAQDHGMAVVLEPGELRQKELFERVATFRDLLNGFPDDCVAAHLDRYNRR